MQDIEELSAACDAMVTVAVTLAYQAATMVIVVMVNVCSISENQALVVMS